MSGGVLQAAGEAARSIATLGWVLILAGTVIFLGVMALLAVALRRRAATVRPALWIVGGGLAFPAVLLATLFAWSIKLQPAWKPVPPPDALVVAVTGRMWWWELRYRDPASGAERFSANELRIPTGRPVYLALTSADVIHSFWVPQLAGKMDMVPGRLQHLLVSADAPGTFRGQCAEFCGEQHARMALQVVAMEPVAFDRWLAAQAQAVPEPASAQQALGREAYLAQRCDACHTVRGVGTPGRLGPDLSNLGERLQLGAGTLANSAEGRGHWIAQVQALKPGARMPSHEQLEPAQLAALSEWLGSLR